MASESKRPCSVPDCDSPFLARELCRKHYKRWRKRGSTDLPDKPLGRRALQRARRADRLCAVCGNLMRAADYRSDALKCRNCERPTPPLTVAELVERDGPLCRLCGAFVDIERYGRDYWAAVVDHVDPWARGGANEPGNLQLAHLRCNAAKRDRVALPASVAERFAREAIAANEQPAQDTAPITCGAGLHPRTAEFGSVNSANAWVCRPCKNGRNRARRAERSDEQRAQQNEARRLQRGRKTVPAAERPLCGAGLHPRTAKFGGPDVRGTWACRPCRVERSRVQRRRQARAG